MNIRLSTGDVRFRISMQELSQVMAGEELCDAIDFSTEKTFRSILRTSSGEQSYVSFDGASLILEVAKHELSQLKEKHPSKEGVQIPASAFNCWLEVDVRKKKKVRAE